ncbi:TetR/AcrR family transcriptional regulator [Gordonia mangrovi]|nr:TetR/AcrR family transcriptional regulator [Gordonia mangrovi]UVF76392.1 TetR/AcrR family transcriptional regulator [Gordonia mangrovi]
MTKAASPTISAVWDDPLAGGLRKIPLQERSRTMVQHVLDTAAELVHDVGFEAVVASPTLLLDATGVSRGSFYAFFETPERVLDELAFRQIKLSVTDLENAMRQRAGRKWTEIVDVLVDYYVEEHRIPLIRELWVRQNLTRRVRELDQLAITDLASLMHREFRLYSPQFAKLRELNCAVAIHSLERLCQFAFGEAPTGNPAIIGEARHMLTTYFADFADT